MEIAGSLLHFQVPAISTYSLQSEHARLNVVYELLQTFYTSQFQISYNETWVSVKI
jgi:hypothetical protein